jgi:hypothetical protein
VLDQPPIQQAACPQFIRTFCRQLIFLTHSLIMPIDFCTEKIDLFMSGHNLPSAQTFRCARQTSSILSALT